MWRRRLPVPPHSGLCQIFLFREASLTCCSIPEIGHCLPDSLILPPRSRWTASQGSDSLEWCLLGLFSHFLLPEAERGFWLTFHWFAHDAGPKRGTQRGSLWFQRRLVLLSAMEGAGGAAGKGIKFKNTLNEGFHWDQGLAQQGPAVWSLPLWAQLENLQWGRRQGGRAVCWSGLFYG